MYLFGCSYFSFFIVLLLVKMILIDWLNPNVLEEKHNITLYTLNS